MSERVQRVMVGMTGASGAIYGVDFLKKFPGEKHLVLSRSRPVGAVRVGLEPP